MKSAKSTLIMIGFPNHQSHFLEGLTLTLTPQSAPPPPLGPTGTIIQYDFLQLGE